MKYLFVIISLAFVLFSFTTKEGEGNSSTSRVDLSSESHTFALDTVIISDSKKIVSYFVFYKGEKQPRKVLVEIDYGSISKLNTFDRVFNITRKDLSIKSNVVAVVYVVSTGNGIRIKLSNRKIRTRLLIEQALKVCHIK